MNKSVDFQSDHVNLIHFNRAINIDYSAEEVKRILCFTPFRS